eukprot:7469394-Pyramimonas_sp.AAC.1
MVPGGHGLAQCTRGLGGPGVCNGASLGRLKSCWTVGLVGLTWRGAVTRDGPSSGTFGRGRDYPRRDRRGRSQRPRWKARHARPREVGPRGGDGTDGRASGPSGGKVIAARLGSEAKCFAGWDNGAA